MTQDHARIVSRHDLMRSDWATQRERAMSYAAAQWIALPRWATQDGDRNDRVTFQRIMIYLEMAEKKEIPEVIFENRRHPSLAEAELQNKLAGRWRTSLHYHGAWGAVHEGESLESRIRMHSAFVIVNADCPHISDKNVIHVSDKMAMKNDEIAEARCQTRDRIACGIVAVRIQARSTETQRALAGEKSTTGATIRTRTRKRVSPRTAISQRSKS